MQPLIVTAAIIRRGEEILVTLRPEGKRHAGLWEFPGGKIEGTETPEAALQREIAEELGLTVVVGALFDVVHYCYDWGAVLILAYECLPSSASVQNLQVAEHRWVTAADLDQLPFLPADVPLITKLKIRAAPDARH